MKTKKNKMKPCILLTMTVNVDREISYLHQTNQQERIDIYLKSIQQWIKTTLPIVIVENSGYTFSIKSPNVEMISFNSKDYDYGKHQMESKGVHEAFAVLYALHHSKFLKKCSHMIKVTGRYFIPFESLIRSIPYSCNAIRQNDPERCEIIGCKKSCIKDLFKLPMKIGNKLESHVERVYQDRIHQLTNVFTLPILKIKPTKRGGKDETYTSL